MFVIFDRWVISNDLFDHIEMIANNTIFKHIIDNDTKAGNAAFVILLFLYQLPFFILLLEQLEGELFFRQLVVEPLAGGKAGGDFIRRVFVGEDRVRRLQGHDATRIVHLAHQDPALGGILPDLIRSARGDVLEGRHLPAVQGDVDAAVLHDGAGVLGRPLGGQVHHLILGIGPAGDGDRAIFIRREDVAVIILHADHFIAEAVEGRREGVVGPAKHLQCAGHGAGSAFAVIKVDLIFRRILPGPSTTMTTLCEQLLRCKCFTGIDIMPFSVIRISGWRGKNDL